MTDIEFHWRRKTRQSLRKKGILGAFGQNRFDEIPAKGTLDHKPPIRTILGGDHQISCWLSELGEQLEVNNVRLRRFSLQRFLRSLEFKGNDMFRFFWIK